MGLKRKLNSIDNRKPEGFCLHRLNGRTVIPKTCIYDYECSNCVFDQWLEEIEPNLLGHAEAAWEKIESKHHA